MSLLSRLFSNWVFVFASLVSSAVYLTVKEGKQLVLPESIGYYGGPILGSSSSSCRDDSNSSIYNDSQSKGQKGTICDYLSDGRTASSLWREQFQELLAASIHPLDRNQTHRDWTQKLLQSLPPHLLERGLHSIFPQQDMRRIINIVDNRLRNPSSSPPLVVAVFGGSVAEGRGCETIPNEAAVLLKKNKNKKPAIQGRGCAWPYRLQMLADHFLGAGVVHIVNVAVGGTNSALALPVLQYRLYPRDTILAKYTPDVIMNAYAVNDNLPPQQFRHAGGNVTSDSSHFDEAFQIAQWFIRTARQSQPCRDPPALIFVDEYFGNQNELLLGEDIRRDAVRLLADHYGMLHVSSSSSVRHFVYGNEKETMFSPKWWKRRKRVVEAHFTMPGHIQMAWTIAYSLLRTSIDYCVNENVSKDNALRSKDTVAEALWTFDTTAIPPELTRHLSLSSIPQKWKNYAQQWNESTDQYCRSVQINESPCPFAFIATPAGTHKVAKVLQGYLKKYTTSVNGWRAANDVRNGGWQNKVGLVAKKPGASMVLTLPNVQNRVRLLTLHWLKSYGEKWANSTAQFDLTIVKDSQVKYKTSFIQQGFHNQKVSITYPFKLDLRDNAAEVGSTIRLSITLIGGSTFKIISLMMCNR